MKKIKYICDFYIPVPNNEGRYFALSACDKASYVHSVLNRLGYDIEIISPSYAKKCSRERTDRLNEHVIVISGFSLGYSNGITKALSRLSAMLWLLYFLLFRCKKGETIISYHGVQKTPFFLFAKYIKRFHYILEVEEIYSALDLKTGAGWRYKLEKAIIDKADSYVFASSQLEEKCNADHKPSVVCNGSYITPDLISEKQPDGKKHLVYAGLIEKDKVAFKSLNIARYLNEDYVIHIIGYGKEEDILLLKELISETNKQTQCKVFYDGLKRGDEYIAFLQSCHIGLCPLSNNKGFQMACFPSKITSYLSNGLLVVTTDNEVLKTSSYNDYLYYVKDDSPKEFAETIKTIRIDANNNPRKCIMAEDERMLVELKQLI